MTATETSNGQKLSVRCWALIADAAIEAGIDPGLVTVTQGGYKRGSGAGASAGTHDDGDVFDIRTWSLPAGRVIPLVVALRRRNVCGWYRAPQYGWTSTGEHIHGVLRDSEDGLSPQARQQVRDYDASLNGLANRGPDPFPRPPQAHWEDDVALTDDDIERIAEAVWRRSVKVDGVDRKMGAMAVSVYKAARVQLPAGEADEAT